jgi:hypothetical protein
MKCDLQSNAPFPVWVLIPAVFVLCAAPVAAPADEKPPGDQLITMNVKNKPLGQVLEELQSATGTSFILNIQWKDIPVSVSLNKTPLTIGLKRMLANYNNIVIYNHAKNSIQIRILGKVEPSAVSKAPPGVVYRPEPLPEVVEETETPDTGAEETPEDEAGSPGLESKKAPSETGGSATEKDDTPTDTTEENAGAALETQESGAGNRSEGGGAKNEQPSD